MAIVFTYTCSSCGHTYKDKLDFHKNKEKKDPNFDKDRAHFCLWDKDFRDHVFAIRKGVEDMARIGKEMKEQEDNKHIYDAIKNLKRLKVAELSTTLAPALEKVGYIEFSLDKPELGKDVTVGFNCLDNISDRNDYDSREVLKKTIDKTLIDTNWRLMSDGISYRSGYLSGRLRAYEREEDLKKLVERTSKPRKGRKPNKTNKVSPKSIKTPDSKDVIP